LAKQKSFFSHKYLLLTHKFLKSFEGSGNWFIGIKANLPFYEFGFIIGNFFTGIKNLITC